MLVYIISFIIGGLIAFILYGKVPVFVSLIISLIIGGAIGFIKYKYEQRKAELEYIRMRKDILEKYHLNLKD